MCLIPQSWAKFPKWKWTTAWKMHHQHPEVHSAWSQNYNGKKKGMKYPTARWLSKYMKFIIECCVSWCAEEKWIDDTLILQYSAEIKFLTSIIIQILYKLWQTLYIFTQLCYGNLWSSKSCEPFHRYKILLTIVCSVVKWPVKLQIVDFLIWSMSLCIRGIQMEFMFCLMSCTLKLSG